MVYFFGKKKIIALIDKIPILQNAKLKYKKVTKITEFIPHKPC